MQCVQLGGICDRWLSFPSLQRWASTDWRDLGRTEVQFQLPLQEWMGGVLGCACWFPDASLAESRNEVLEPRLVVDTVLVCSEIVRCNHEVNPFASICTTFREDDIRYRGVKTVCAGLS